jgi:hypothetical protein
MDQIGRQPWQFIEFVPGLAALVGYVPALDVISFV